MKKESTIQDLGPIAQKVLCPKGLGVGGKYHLRRTKASGTLCGSGQDTYGSWMYGGRQQRKQRFVKLSEERALKLELVLCKTCAKRKPAVEEQQALKSMNSEERAKIRSKKAAVEKRRRTLEKKKLASELRAALLDI